MKSKRWISTGCFVLSFVSAVAISASRDAVLQASAGRIYIDANEITPRKVALVLGTKKTLSHGRINLYFKLRMDAAARLYAAGKVEFLLVSGDNGDEHNDEPTDMKNSLIERGVPENRIYLDYAGFRTLDSIVRAHKIFGQTKFTVVSQPQHVARAIYIAKAHGLDAIGYAAKKPARHALRESLARVKAVLDVFCGVGPKFYGPPIKIKQQP